MHSHSLMAICKEKEIFRNNYTKFCNIVKQEDGLHPHLVEKQIISPDDLADIRSAKVIEKGPTLLRHISSPLEAGQTKGFYALLEVMREHGRLDTQKFAKGIQRKCQPNSNGKQIILLLLVINLDIIVSACLLGRCVL